MKLPTWKEMPEGIVILEAGNAQEYETGSWRTFRPVVDKSKCINCLFCWIYCPDTSIIVKDEKMEGIDYSHCKGCGICSKVCPAKAISMVEEGSL
ncbi:MAG: 4Fe-4S binding protein [bacterium]|nr:4Fe-4S binding protein [bacterium]